MRTVFRSTEELCHVFANLSGDDRFERHGKAGNVFFRNGILYSYGHHFAIAAYTRDSDIVQFTTRDYSVSTSRHKRIAAAALSHHRIAHVPYPETNDSEKFSNFRYWRSEAKALSDKLANARKPEKYLPGLSAIANQISAYIALFPDVSVPSDVAALLDGIDFDAHNEAIAEREAARIARENEKHALALADWRTFETNSLGVFNGISYLRFNPAKDRIETSQGIELGMRYARELFGQIKHQLQCEAGRSCGRENLIGQRILDRYTITHLDNSRIQIGCHNIPISEIDAIGDLLGWKTSN